MLKTFSNKSGFTIVETLIAISIITIVSAVTISAITKVRINSNKIENYDEARFLAKNSLELFIFSDSPYNDSYEYSFSNLLMNVKKCNEYEEQLEEWISSSSESIERTAETFHFVPIKDSDNAYTYTYKTSFYTLTITVNYSLTRPTYSAICIGKNDNELFSYSYEKFNYEKVQS